MGFISVQNPRCLLTAASLALVLGCVLLASAASADYRQKAEEQTDFIQAHFYDAKAQRYHPKFPAAPKELPYEFMWGNGVEFTALAGAARVDPEKYRPLLYEFRQGLQAYWDPEAPVPGFNAYCSGPRGTDKYYDDNEWLVLGFAEAYETTHDPMFLKDAQNTQCFVLSGWDSTLGGGIYWKLDHKSKNTCSNAPAAAAALRLYQLDKEEDQLAWALKIRDWLNPRLQDKDGLYWDGMSLDGHVEKTKWSYNSALMIRADILLAQLGNDPGSLDEARRVADAGIAAWTDPGTGSLHRSDGKAIFTHLFCEALLRLYDATHDTKYLNAVRREAAFAYRYVRDPSGGYYDQWTTTGRTPGEAKTLICSASVARLYWLLAPYPDEEEMKKSAAVAANSGNKALAEELLRQAVESDPEDIAARARLTSLQKKPVQDPQRPPAAG